jgi:acyl carrier protein
MHDEMDTATLSALIQEACGVRVSRLRPELKLSEIGLVGLDLLACIGLIESRYGIEFPADLLSALETVDDLVHYTAVKRSQP